MAIVIVAFEAKQNQLNQRFSVTDKEVWAERISVWVLLGLGCAFLSALMYPLSNIKIWIYQNQCTECTVNG